MRKSLGAILCLLVLAGVAFGQTTTVTGTLADTTTQIAPFSNVTITFAGPSSAQQNGHSFTQKFVTTTDVNANFSIGIPDNGTIMPAQTGWNFQFCPAATVPCTSFGPIFITGASMNITASIVIPAMVLAPQSIPAAYVDSEIQQATAIEEGSLYWNLLSGVLRQWSGTAWGSVTAGAGGTNGQIQYNSNGSLAGDATVTDGSGNFSGMNSLSIGNTLSAACPPGSTGCLAIATSGSGAATLGGALVFQTLTGVGNTGWMNCFINGGVSATTCLDFLAPVPTRAGDIIYFNGTDYVTLPGNNSGTSFLQSTNTGVLSWAAGTSSPPAFLVNAQTASYPTVASDFSNFKFVSMNSASATTVTLLATPPASGQGIFVQNFGAGTLAISPNGKTINGSASNLSLSAGSAAAPTWAMVVSNGTNYLAFGPTISTSVSLSSIVAATASNTIANGNFPQIWNFALTTNSIAGLQLGETTAATGTGEDILNVQTLSGSTAFPTQVFAGGATNGWHTNTSGQIAADGTGGVLASAVNSGQVAVANGGTGLSGATNANSVPCFNTTTTMAGSGATLTASGIVVGAAAPNCLATNSAEQIKLSIFQNTQSGNQSEYSGGADTAGSSTPEASGFFRGGAYTGTGTGATAVGGSGWLYGGPNNANNATTYAGAAGVFAGQSTNGTALGHQGIKTLGTAYAKGTTVTQWNLQQLASAEKTQDAAASPTSLLGVAYNVQAGATSSVWVADEGDIPINASAAVTAGDTVCAGGTAGQVTDSGSSNGICPNQITVGHVTRVSGTARVLTPFASSTSNDSTVTLSTTLPLVHWEAPVPQDYFQTPTHCASSASPAVCGGNKTGFVVVAAGATTVVVNTTNVTANSTILLTEDQSLGTALSVTCNTTFIAQAVTARTAGTSFTIGVSAAPATNPLCISYEITN